MKFKEYCVTLEDESLHNSEIMLHINKDGKIIRTYGYLDNIPEFSHSLGIENDIRICIRFVIEKSCSGKRGAGRFGWLQAIIATIRCGKIKMVL